jgi:hypothetical protein
MGRPAGTPFCRCGLYRNSAAFRFSAVGTLAPFLLVNNRCLLDLIDDNHFYGYLLRLQSEPNLRLQSTEDVGEIRWGWGE